MWGSLGAMCAASPLMASVLFQVARFDDPISNEFWKVRAPFRWMLTGRFFMRCPENMLSIIRTAYVLFQVARFDDPISNEFWKVRAPFRWMLTGRFFMRCPENMLSIIRTAYV